MRHVQPLHEQTRETDRQAREAFFRIVPVLTGPAPVEAGPTTSQFNLICDIGQPPGNTAGSMPVKIGSFDNLGMARAHMQFYSYRLQETLEALRDLWWRGDPDRFFALRDRAGELVRIPDLRKVRFDVEITIETPLDDVDVYAEFERNGLKNLSPIEMKFLTIQPNQP